MKKFLLIVLGVLLVLFARASVVKITVKMDQKVCVIERFRNDGSMYSREEIPMKCVSHSKDRVESNSGFHQKNSSAMSTFGIGDTFNVINDNSPVPYPNWRFMRYFSVNTGGNPIAFASIKICEASDTNSGNWLYYTTGMPIYNTDDSLLTDFGIWNPCIPYAYGVDLYLSGDTAKSPLEIIQITSCAGFFEQDYDKEIISVFPNPATDILQSPKLNGIETRVVSSEGKTVWEGMFPEEGIDVRNFSSGLYLICTKKGTAKFLKE